MRTDRSPAGPAKGIRRLPSLRRYLPYTAVLTAVAVPCVGVGLPVRSLL
ncbi:hypothetical protein [Streptomyces sp. NBC_01022]|nr:hypothetical protein [Streptomyces sp. NBC_01022]WRZ82762.1 hypothetical protein OG316_22100 [Streptomyces sp. NBC_01022]